MIWQPEFTDKILSRKPGAVHIIDYDWKASIEIEIDHDVMTEEKLHQINNFWSDSEYRLNKHG
ncbi:DUF2528 family protein, partial [Escherichia coli]